MLRSLCNKKGMSMVEVLLAIFLTAVGIMALLALPSQGWRTMAKSDYVGRASGILYKTLENYQTLIINPCYAPTEGAQPTAYFYTSGQISSVSCQAMSPAISGNICYTVNTTITKVSVVGVKPRVYLVTVTVTWPASSTGYKESMIVATQSLFDFPPNCTEI